MGVRYKVEIDITDKGLVRILGQAEKAQGDVERATRRTNRAMSEAEKAYRDAVRVLASLRTEEERLQEKQQVLNRAMRAGKLTSDQYRQGMQRLQQQHRSSRTTANNLAGSLAKVVAAYVAIRAAMAAVRAVAKAAERALELPIKGAAYIESSELQIKQFTKSFRLAAFEINRVRQFSIVTPFRFPDLLNANKQLLAFGINLLDSHDSLKLVADASAATGRELQNVSFWFARAYAQIQNGTPLGEVQLRLSELGIALPGFTEKLEKMRREGKKQREIWDTFILQFAQFKGATADLAKTFVGRVSTMQDKAEEFARQVGEGGPMQVAKEVVVAVTDVLTDLNTEGEVAATIGQYITNSFFNVARATAKIYIEAKKLKTKLDDLDLPSYVKWINRFLAVTPVGPAPLLSELFSEQDLKYAFATYEEVYRGAAEESKKAMALIARNHEELAKATQRFQEQISLAPSDEERTEIKEAFAELREELASSSMAAQRYFNLTQTFSNLKEKIQENQRRLNQANLDFQKRSVRGSAEQRKYALLAYQETQSVVESANAQILHQAQELYGAWIRTLTESTNDGHEVFSALTDFFVDLNGDLVGQTMQEIDAMEARVETAVEAIRKKREEGKELTEEELALLAAKKKADEEELDRQRRLAEQAKERSELRREALGVMSGLMTEEERHAETVAKITEAYEKGVITLQQYLAATVRLKAEYLRFVEEVRKKEEEAARRWAREQPFYEIANEISQQFSSSLRQVITDFDNADQHGKQFFTNLLDYFVEYALQKLVVEQLLAKVEASLSGEKKARTVTETSSNTLAAASEIFKAHASIPFVGPAIAAALTAFMMASLAATKVASIALPAFAKGGYVDRPTIGLVGEAGPEYVVPKETFTQLFMRLERQRLEPTLRLINEGNRAIAARDRARASVVNHGGDTIVQNFRAPIFQMRRQVDQMTAASMVRTRRRNR